jgi:hypothetical protein
MNSLTAALALSIVDMVLDVVKSVSSGCKWIDGVGLESKFVVLVGGCGCSC